MRRDRSGQLARLFHHCVVPCLRDVLASVLAVRWYSTLEGDVDGGRDGARHVFSLLIYSRTVSRLSSERIAQWTEFGVV